MKLTVGELVKMSGGRLLCGAEDIVISSVCIDSRKIVPGGLFVPLIGEKVDSHRFLDQVIAAGAAAVITQEHETAEGPAAWIRVEDTQVALQKIAAGYRAKFSLPVVGITGSVGKTTTKEMVALALSSALRVMKTEGNFNSQIGLPLTMFRLEPEDEVAVIEMGMSNFGEMGRLAEIACPDFAVITNIGVSHIEHLKTRENIRSEKLHITDRFRKGSVLFANGDDLLLAELRGKTRYPIKFFGTQPWCDYRAERLEAYGTGTKFLLCTGNKRIAVDLPAPGMHYVLNALAAAAVADTLSIDLVEAMKALKSYEPPAMRQQVSQVGGITLIDDSYNASPDSMKSSLGVLAGFSTKGRKIAVLADMLELGEYSARGHYEVGEQAGKLGVDVVIAVGKEAENIAVGAKEHGVKEVHFLKDNQAVLELLRQMVKPGDAVLVKGSRGMHMEEIVHGIFETQR